MSKSKELDFLEVMKAVRKSAELKPTLPPKGKPALFLLDPSLRLRDIDHYAKIVRFDGTYVYLDCLLNGYCLQHKFEPKYELKRSITRLPRRIRDYLRTHSEYQAWLRGEGSTGPLKNKPFNWEGK